jgi:hypothetical protein
MNSGCSSRSVSRENRDEYRQKANFPAPFVLVSSNLILGRADFSFISRAVLAIDYKHMIAFY